MTDYTNFSRSDLVEICEAKDESIDALNLELAKEVRKQVELRESLDQQSDVEWLVACLDEFGAINL